MTSLSTRRGLYGWFVVAIMLLAMVVSYVDRQVVAIVVEPMRHDLAITDTAVSWLYGIFALFYAIAGIPIARWADRAHRGRIIALGIFIWSIATITCGLARSFVEVLLARIGVGAAEASLVPAGTSLINDLFSKEQVPIAVSVFNAGGVVGSGLAFVIGGVLLELIESSGQPLLPILADLSPWQQLFIYAGLPGLLLAPLMLLVREPGSRGKPDQTVSRSSFADVLRFYRHNRVLVLTHHLGFLCFSLLGFCVVFWSVSFLTRVHGMPAAGAAQSFGWTYLLAGPWGGVCAAVFATWLARRGARGASLTAAMIGAGLSIPAILALQIAADPALALVLYIPVMFLNTTPYGLAYASISTIAPPAIRATVVSIFMFVLSMGMFLGPPMAGVLNQYLFPGTEGIRWSLATAAIGCGTVGLTLLAICRYRFIVFEQQQTAGTAQKENGEGL